MRVRPKRPRLLNRQKVLGQASQFRLDGFRVAPEGSMELGGILIGHREDQARRPGQEVLA